MLCAVFSVRLNKTCPALFLMVWWFVTLAFHPRSSGFLGEEVESAPIYCTPPPPMLLVSQDPIPSAPVLRKVAIFSYKGGGCLGYGKVTLRGVLGVGGVTKRNPGLEGTDFWGRCVDGESVSGRTWMGS